MRFVYSKAQLEFLRKHFPSLCVEDLTAAFNAEFGTDKTPGNIRSTCKNHKILCYRSRGQLNKGRGLLLTEDQIDFLKANYGDLSRQELTDALNKAFNTTFKLGQIVSFTKNHKIRSGRTGHFEKGHVPFNAGTKGFMKPNRTSFKKGDMPHNAVPVGTQVTDPEGYRKIKVKQPNEWEYIHRRIWREAHGDIPNDHAVVFKDGNKENIALGNLEMIPRGELGIRNKFGVSKLPPELKQIGATVAKLRLKTGQVKRDQRRSA